MARTGRRRTTTAPVSTHLDQLPWRSVRNRYGPMEALDAEGVATVHEASLRVLEELGIELWSPAARRLFADAGAIIGGPDDTVVRVGRDIIEAALASAPAEFTLTARNPQKSLQIGGNNLAFGLVAGPPSVHDEIRGRRSSNMVDYENFIRLAHYFNAIHIIGNQVAAPMELPASPRRHRDDGAQPRHQPR